MGTGTAPSNDPMKAAAALHLRQALFDADEGANYRAMQATALAVGDGVTAGFRIK